MSSARQHATTILSALMVVAAIAALAVLSPPSLARNPPAAGIDKLTFHHNRQRTGWNDRETILRPQTVSSPHFGLLWEGLPLDDYNGRPPRLFAAPLYVHAVEMTQGPLAGRTASALYAVTTTGYAYAINAAQAGAVAPGELLWREWLAEEPCFEGTMGNTATPVIDLERQRFYVTSCSSGSWRAHALDIRSGERLPGWPVVLDGEALNAPGIHKNGSARRFVHRAQRRQRGALNLSPDGSRLYITFGEPGGWIVAVDTGQARVASSFSSTASDDELVMGGIWASGGPAVDDQGYVYVSTGTSEKKGRMEHVFDDSAGNWGQSILQLRDDPVRGFELVGTYTPFNYCIASAWDIDLASSGTVLIDLDPRTTSTPRLLALGGAKQGNVYLVNRAPMPGRLSKRQPCSEDSASDLSLLAPEPQPQFGRRGPINVFGPYSETKGLFDQARSRSTLAYFRDDAGKSYVFVTGASKTGPRLTQSVPPGLARLQIVTAPGEPAFLRPTHLERTHTLYNASSPIVTSHGGRDATVWVLDTNAERSVPLYGPNAPQPVLYAFDATNLKLLWKSAPGQLATTGKYNEPTVVNGVVYVGTDRIQAFGVRPPSAPGESRFTSLFDGRTPTQDIPAGPAPVPASEALSEDGGERSRPLRAALCRVPQHPGAGGAAAGLARPATAAADRRRAGARRHAGGGHRPHTSADHGHRRVPDVAETGRMRTKHQAAWKAMEI